MGAWGRIRRRSAVRPWFVAAVLAATTPTTSCASQNCTAIGAEPGVAVTLTDSLLPAAGRLEIRACPESACASALLAVDTDGAFVVLPQLGAAVPVTLRVEVRDVDTDTVVGGGELTATTARVAPNGSGCDPVVGRLGVTASTDGLTLT